MTYRPEGDPLTASIVFVGEAPARREMIDGRPFSGSAGFVHDQCLEFAGIPRSGTYTTNVFDFPVYKPKGKSVLFKDKAYTEKLFSDTNEGFTPLGKKSVERLQDELSKTTANVIVPLGSPAFRSICEGRGITKWRGSILPATLIPGRKTIPSIHPANALHGQYITRYIIRGDYKRAKRESKFPDIRRPPYNFRLRPTFGQCVETLEFIKTLDKYACDIEVGFFTPNREPLAQATRISWAWTDNDAISIPYGDASWTLEQEINLWKLTAEVLEKEGPIKIFQNGVFDCQFLLFVHGILVAGPLEDTMIAHHIMYPDFRKGLGYLSSLYTDQPYWKGMVKHGQIENPEG